MSVNRGQIEIDSEGAWHWEYRMNLKKNRSMLVYILVPIYICMGIFAVYGLVAKLGTWIVLAVAGGMSAVCTILALLIYFIAAFMTAGRYRIPYYMNEALITVHIGDPALRISERWDENQKIFFENINLIRLKREDDMILLGDILPFQVYVPKESYDLVLNYILERVRPQVREKFEEKERENNSN